MKSDNHLILRNTTQICALALIVGIGAPIQLLAYWLGIKPDSEVQKQKKAIKDHIIKKSRTLKGAEEKVNENLLGDDDFKKVKKNKTGADLDSDDEFKHSVSNVSHRSQLLEDVTDNFAGCHNEQEVLDLIQKQFYELIGENTYPWIIEKWVKFDNDVLMPCFKRPYKIKNRNQDNLSEHSN